MTNEPFKCANELAKRPHLERCQRQCEFCANHYGRGIVFSKHEPAEPEQVSSVDGNDIVPDETYLESVKHLGITAEHLAWLREEAGKSGLEIRIERPQNPLVLDAPHPYVLRPVHWTYKGAPEGVALTLEAWIQFGKKRYELAISGPKDDVQELFDELLEHAIHTLQERKDD